MSEVYIGTVSKTISAWRTGRYEVIHHEPPQQQTIDPMADMSLSAAELNIPPGTTCLVEYRDDHNRLVYQRNVLAT